MMADIIDRAQESDREFQEKVLAAFRRRQEPSLFGRLVKIARCIECDLDIPPERLKAKPDAIRCVECQAREERK